MTFKEFLEKYNYDIFPQNDFIRVQFKAHVDEWYDIIQKEESFSVIERMERGKTNLVYQSLKYENCLMYIASRLLSSKDCFSHLINLREAFEKENGYAIDNSKNTLQRTYEFLNRNNLREYYSTEKNIKPMTRMVIEENNKYSMYKIDENLNKLFIISFEKGDAGIFRSLVNKTIEKKYLIDFEKEMFEIFKIEAHDIPKEIKKNIYE